MRKLNTLSALAIALTGSPAFAADVQGFECERKFEEAAIHCGPWSEGKPRLAFENVPDLYSKG